MRVSGGTAKGRRLRVPHGLVIRPTTDKVKQALFTIVAERLQGALVLDLFAGTGQLGIEALSRGARYVIFVERDRRIAFLLKRNVEACGLGDRATIYIASATRFVNRLSPRHPPIDLVIVDPPYHSPELKKLLPALGRGAMMNPKGLLVIEHFHKVLLDKQIGSLYRLKQYRYGDTVLTLYKKDEDIGSLREPLS